jgi:hypothetical protein
VPKQSVRDRELLPFLSRQPPRHPSSAAPDGAACWIAVTHFRHGGGFRGTFSRRAEPRSIRCRTLHLVQAVIDKIFPFAKIKEALAYLEAGKAKGKVVVSLSL